MSLLYSIKIAQSCTNDNISEFLENYLDDLEKIMVKEIMETNPETLEDNEENKESNESNESEEFILKSEEVSSEESNENLSDEYKTKKIDSDDSENNESDEDDNEESNESESIEEYEDDLLDERKCKTYMKLLVEEISKFLFPSAELFGKVELGIYLSLVNNFYNLIFSFQQSEGIILKHYETIQFISKFLGYAVSINLSSDEILTVCSKFIRGSELVIYEPAVVNEVFAFLDTKLAQTNIEEGTQRFKLYYYNLLFAKYPEYLDEIIRNIESSNI